ncbi:MULTISPECIES: substrate-binding periplasmic protein [unclassified Moraxella]|uniref:substrate-binding periplasmic protein n=1 Tax=unclassified Moraxella TaxID=2685852 RepID=UPI003AF502AE
MEQKTNLITPVYHVAIDADFPPYSFVDDSKKQVGFDIDLIEQIAQQEGFKVKIQPIAWDSLVKTLPSGTHDIVLGGIALSDIEDIQLQQKYLISIPYNYGKDTIVVKKTVNNIHTINDLSGKKVVVGKDSIYAKELKNLLQPNTQLIEVPSDIDLLKTVATGQADAGVGSRNTLRYYLNQNPNYPLTLTGNGSYFDSPFPLVILIKNDNPKLTNQINKGIKTLIQNGKYTQMYQKWFGVEPDIMPAK